MAIKSLKNFACYHHQCRYGQISIASTLLFNDKNSIDNEITNKYIKDKLVYRHLNRKNYYIPMYDYHHHHNHQNIKVYHINF